VEALKLGALDYLRKPVDPPHLQRVLNNIADNITIREENSTLRRRLADVGELGPLFGRSIAMRKVITAIERLAQSSASVVITREGGTGKELVALSPVITTDADDCALCAGQLRGDSRDADGERAVRA